MPRILLSAIVPSFTSRLDRSPPGHRAPLSRIQSPALILVDQALLALLHDLRALGQDHLDVARVAHVRVDAAVGSVGSSSLLRRLVDLDVLDDQVAGVEAF